MADKSKNLTIRFLADTKDAVRNIDSMKQRIHGIGKATSGQMNGQGRGGVFGGLQNLLGRTSTSTGSLMGSFGGLALKAGAVVGALATLANSLRGVIDAGNQAEGSIASLEVLMGSQRRAIDTYNSALQMSTRTPFDPREVASAAALAAQYGVNAFEQGWGGLRRNQNVMEVVAGMASFRDMHGNFIGMQRAASALLRGELAMLDNYRGLVMPAYNEAKRIAQVGTPRFVQEFVRRVGQLPQFMQMATRQSQTISGIWSTIRGNLGLIFTYLSGAAERSGVVTLWSNLREIMTDLSAKFGRFIQYIRPLLMEVGATFGLIFNSIWSVLKMIWQFVKPLLLPVLWLMYQAFRGMLWVTRQILSFYVWMYNKVTQFLRNSQRWLDVTFRITERLRAAVQWFQRVFTVLQMGWILFKVFIEGMFYSISYFFDKLPGKIMNVFRLIGSAISRFFDTHRSKITTLTNLLRVMTGIATFGTSEISIRAVQEVVERVRARSRTGDAIPRERSRPVERPRRTTPTRPERDSRRESTPRRRGERRTEIHQTISANFYGSPREDHFIRSLRDMSGNPLLDIS